MLRIKPAYYLKHNTFNLDNKIKVSDSHFWQVIFVSRTKGKGHPGYGKEAKLILGGKNVCILFWQSFKR